MTPHRKRPPEEIELISGVPSQDAALQREITLTVRDGLIDRVVDGVVDGAWHLPEPWILAPGFVDLQVNGIEGIHIANQPERLVDVAAMLPAAGVTSFLATLPSANAREVAHCNDAALAHSPDHRSARLLGLHLEGPAISPVRAGAHPTERITGPLESVKLIEFEAVRLITIAPELDGANDLIEAAHERGITVAAGHTDATYAEGQGAIASGVLMLTHCFNAMRPVHHRDPGLALAYIESADATVCLISDRVHVVPPVMSLVYALKDASHIALVSDSIATTKVTGCADGPASAGPDRALIGGMASLGGSFPGLIENKVADLEDLVTSATAAPSRAAGFPKIGSLSVGSYADVVALGPRGEVGATWVAGRLAWTSLDFPLPAS